MLPKKLRLGRSSINSFFKDRSLVFHSGQVTLRARRNHKNITQWAFVVSSSLKRTATQRNVVRRRMNEAAQSLLKSAKPGWDAVFFTKLASRMPPSYRCLRDDMILTLRLCGIL